MMQRMRFVVSSDLLKNLSCHKSCCESLWLVTCLQCLEKSLQSPKCEKRDSGESWSYHGCCTYPYRVEISSLGASPILRECLCSWALPCGVEKTFVVIWLPLHISY